MAVKKFSSGQFEIEMDTTSVDTMLDKLVLATSQTSLEEFMRVEVNEFFETRIGDTFNEEGGVKTGFWAPLSEATVAIREALGYGGDSPINVRTGELQDFVQYGREYLQGDDWVEMQVPGSPPDPITAQKLKTAQQGNPSNPIPGFGPTPPRPILAVDEMDLARIMEMLVVHIDGYLVAGGLGSVLADAGVAAA